MCRIAGIIHKSFPVVELEQMVKTMCDKLIHGGPDDGGVEAMGQHHVVLGNRRLALQDLSFAGHQPMHYDNRFSVTYNGELYNFPELKRQLENLGHRFKSHTDTEVVLAAFAQWNTQAFSKFNGMFAFALWDSREEQLFLVRDAAGMKPLYYAQHNGGISFASEIRALNSLPYLKEENSNWPVYLMAYGHIPEPVTTLLNVKPLKKGTFLRYSYASGETSYQSFTHYSYMPVKARREEAIAELREVFPLAVKRHLISDASIGAFLSGGLDSSIISTLAAKNETTRLNTFSLYFEEKSFSEEKYQKELIKNISCSPYQHLLSEREFNESLPEVLESMDMPCCDGINTWFISKYARAAGLKAVLSGVGGDELFGGYPSFRRMKAALSLQKAPALLKSVAGSFSAPSLKRLPFLKLEGMTGLYLFLRGYFMPSEIAQHLGSTEKEIWTILQDLPALNDIHLDDSRDAAGWMEFNLYMQNQLLRDADVMGMAHSLEIRLPFLDSEMVKFAYSLKPEIKYPGTHPKQMLIDAFSNSIPREVWNRPKMGFGFPFARWLAGNEELKSKMDNVNTEAKGSYRKFLKGRMHWSRMMALMLLANKGVIENQV